MIKKYILFFFLIIITGCAQKTINIEQSKKNHQIHKKNSDSKTDDVEIQFLSEMMTYKNIGTMATDMGVMMAAQEGASMANAQLTAEGQLLATIISKDSQTLQTDMQSFQSKAQSDQQKQLQAMVNAFSTAQQNVQAQTQQAADASNTEINYIYQNISINQPAQNFIFNQIQFDQLFSLGTMYTPQGALWKNPFSVGDWEYEPATNSFWQYQSSPIFTSSTDDSGVTTSSSLQAENNSIFTEYCTAQPSYTISGSLSFNQVNYPFFAGIIFNKARWISGDFDAIRKCRMIGIYGASATDIGVYFAQQYTMNDAQLKASGSQSPIQTPLQQIINKQVKKQISLPSSAFSSLNNTPLTLNFKIINSAKTVQFFLWSGKNAPATFTLSNLDPSIFMYHGIGFICPGAIVEFTLNQPNDLVFTAQAISNYKD